MSGPAVSRSNPSDNPRVGGSAAASAFNYDSNANRAVVTPTSRDRNGRPVVGTATARRDVVIGGGTYPFSPFGRWSPFYGSGFGYNVGFVTYNPWYYGSTRWIYGRYGLWPTRSRSIRPTRSTIEVTTVGQLLRRGATGLDEQLRRNPRHRVCRGPSAYARTSRTRRSR